MNIPVDLTRRSYQVFGACTLEEAIARYKMIFGHEPELVIAHPDQATGSVVPAIWCQCSRTPGWGPFYCWPSRKGKEE